MLAVKVICQDLPTNTRLPYSRHTTNFLAWLETQALAFSLESLKAYKAGMLSQNLSPSLVNQTLAAIRFFVRESAKHGYISTEQAEQIAKIESIKTSGQKLGTWLNQTQLEKLLNAPLVSRFSNSLLATRDQAILAVLGGAGLRRNEVAKLTVEQVRFVEQRWVLVDIEGKRGKFRSVPIAAWVKQLIDVWLKSGGIHSGFIFRACSWRVFDDEQIPTVDGIDHLTPESIRQAVLRYSSESLGFPVNPHDVRRSFARIARMNKCPLEQIKLSLGHERIETTEIYTRMEIDFENSPSDFLHIEIQKKSLAK